MSTVAPPEELKDVPAGCVVALVVPFGEDPDPEHPQARVYGWGDLKLPRKSVDVNVDHRAGEVIGLASSWVMTRDGMWAALKLGRTGQALLRKGNAALSVEALGDQITGVALVTAAGTPMFSSARIIDPPAPIPEAPTRFGLDPRTGLIAFPPPPRPPSPMPSAPSRRVVGDMAAAARDLAVARGPDPQVEVARARRLYEDRLRSAAEARVDWEQVAVENAARGAAELERQRAAAAVREDGVIAAREFAERMERLEAEAERQRRSLWRRAARRIWRQR